MVVKALKIKPHLWLTWSQYNFSFGPVQTEGIGFPFGSTYVG